MTTRKTSEDLQSAGRPSKYIEEYNQLAYRCALLGATDKQLAGFLDVSEATINNWKLKYPEFLESTKRGKAIADSKVAEALYQRSLGYSHDEEKIFQYEGKPVRVKTKKHYPPDTQAASLWLRNRQPAKWRDNTDHTLHLDKQPETPEELDAAIDEMKEKIERLEAEL